MPQFIIDAQVKYAPLLQLVARYAYASGRLVYEGTHSEVKALTSDPNWAIKKHTYSGNDRTMTQGPLVGSWDSRADLGW